MGRILILLLCWTATSLGAQKNIDANAFVQNALTQMDESPSNTYNKFKNSWIDEIQLRTQTRDFKLNQQEYTLRVSPSGRAKRKAQNSYYEALKNTPDYDAEDLRKQLLEQVYKDWITLHFLAKRESLMQEIKLLKQDKKTIIEKYQSIYEYDFQALINLATSSTDIRNSENKMLLKRRHILQKYSLDPTDSLITTELLSPAGIILKIEDTPALVNDPTKVYKQTLLQHEMDIELKEKRQLLDFAQLRYRGPHDDELQERISLGFGFKINSSGDKNLKIRELEYRIKELDVENRNEKLSQSQKSDQVRLALKTQIEHYNYLAENINVEREKLLNISKQIQKKEGFDPIYLVKIEERNLGLKMDQIDLLEDIYSNYLKYLDEAQLISESTLVDYLSNY